MEFDMADIKPTVWNLLLILVAILIVVPLAKWFFNDVVKIGPLTSLVNMV